MIYLLETMINKPSSYIADIGKNIFYTTMLFAALQLNASFSDAKYSPDNEKGGVENTIDLKAIYKANISKSILEAKSFPIHLTYQHEKELKEWWFTLRKTISFDEKIQAFILADDAGKQKKLRFQVKVPFAYNNDEIKTLYVKSFGFNIKENKFTMTGIYKREANNAFKEVIGKMLVWSVVERTINLQKIVMLNTILPWAQWEKIYPVKIPINNITTANPTGDIVEATIIEVVPKKNKTVSK